MSLQDLKNSYRNRSLDKWAYIDEMYKHHAALFEYGEFLKDTNISGIEISDGLLVMTFRDSGVKFICSKGDKRLAPFDTLNFGRYEAEELEMQKKLMGPESVILDIGGNFGWYAIHIAKAFPASKIFSFEPIPNTFSQLQKNLALNEIQNVIALPFGFSDAEGSFDFFFDPSLSVNASLQNLTDKPTVQAVTCSVKTLDRWTDENFNKPDFIKCDVEGAELLVFKGGAETLKKYKPVVFSEMLRKWTAKFNYHPNDIIRLFTEMGYSVFCLDGEYLKPVKEVNESTVETNFFFLHQDVHQSVIERYCQ